MPEQKIAQAGTWDDVNPLPIPIPFPFPFPIDLDSIEWPEISNPFKFEFPQTQEGQQKIKDMLTPAQWNALQKSGQRENVRAFYDPTKNSKGCFEAYVEKHCCLRHQVFKLCRFI